MIGAQIIGFKKTGKTALAVALAGELTRRGHKVGALKFTHLASLDKADTDTDKLLEVCGAVGALCGRESAVFWRGRRAAPDMLGLLGAEAVVVEGGKERVLAPRVLVLTDPAQAAELSDPALVLATFGPIKAEGLPHVADVAALADLVIERGFVLPGLDCGACGRPDCAAMVADVLAGRAVPGDCQAMSGTLSVQVDGRPLAINPFVARILGSGIRGLLSELKGFGPGRIDIAIS